MTEFDFIEGILVGAVPAFLVAWWASGSRAAKDRDEKLAEVASSLATINGELRQLHADAISNQTLFSTKLDEIRRRLIAVERKTHGFDLDGTPIFDRDQSG